MTLFESVFTALCFGMLLGIVRFSLLAFLPDNPVSRVLARLDRA